MIVISTSILIIETILFIFLIRKYKFINPLTISYFVAYFYFNAVFIDYLFLGIKANFLYNRSINIDYDGNVFLLYNVICLLFFITFYIITIIFRKNFIYRQYEVLDIKIIGAVTNVVLVIFILYNLYETINNYSLIRSERGQSQTPITLILRNIINYFFILVFCIKSKGKLVVIFIVSTIAYMILSFEREPFIIIFLCLAFKYKSFNNWKYVFLSILSLIFILFVWKNFYSNVLYSTGGGLKAAQNNLKEASFSLAGLDPQISFLLVYDYLNGHNIFIDYEFSYLTGPINQVYRAFSSSNYENLAEHASRIYVSKDYGLAFSILLESLLNLSFIGPIFLSFLIGWMLSKVISLRNKFGNGIIVSGLYIITKFMRTELATLIKLQIFSLLIASLIFLVVFKLHKNKTYE